MELYLHDIKIENRNPTKPTGFDSHTYVHIFAVDSTGDPVFVEVKDFRPWMYAELGPGVDFASFKSELQQHFWYRNVVSCELVQRKRFIGFSDNRLFDYVLLRFTGLLPMFCCRKTLRETTFQGHKIITYEDKVDPVLKFFHETKVRPSSYFFMENYHRVFGDGRTHCDMEFTVESRHLSNSSSSRPPPPMTMCAYDIESSGLDPKTDFVFQVSLCFSRLGDNLEDSGDHASSSCKDGMVICVGKTDSLDGTPIVEVSNEVSLLEKFRDVVVERKVCILVGYNSYQFDGQFMYKRAVETYSSKTFRKIGFLRDEEAELKVKILESSALGKNELAQFIIPGRLEFDALMTLRRNHKLSSYKLNAVCEKFFGGTKDDVSYQDILEACTTKDPHKLGVIAKYCYQDSWLVLRLVDKLKDVYNGMEMSKLCKVPLNFIESRGQEVKCMSLILDRIHGSYVCNHVPAKDNESTGYQGATVIDASVGFHVKDPVVCLDFASLYPSIMRWKNLCYTTFVIKSSGNHDKDPDPSYLGIDGVHYEHFETSPGHFETFAHRPGEKGILSLIEENLGESRKATKKLMKEVDKEKDQFRYNLLNSKQLAKKVTMNSLYGFCGTSNGVLPLVAIAAAVTCTGRKMIDETAEFVRTTMGATVVYGDTDSVMCTFPVSDEVRAEGDRALLRHAYAKGLEAEEKASALFGHPVLLEYEKMYWPFLLLSEKRYATMMYERPDDVPKMTSSGLVTVRRDNAPVVRDTANEVINLLMAKKTDDEVLGYVRGVLQSLENSDIPLEKLVISNELKKRAEEYASPTPHSVLSGKIASRSKQQKVFREVVKPLYETPGGFDDKALCLAYARLENLRKQLSFREKKDLDMYDFVEGLAKGAVAVKHAGFDKEAVSSAESLANAPEGRLVQIGINNSFDLGQHYRKFSSYDKVYWEEPRLGNRIPYVIVRGRGAVNDRSEDPKYVAASTHLKVDTLYYIVQQLKNPLTGILKHTLGNPERLSQLFTEFSRRASNANLGRREITSFFTRNVKSKT
ncbi:unnamed protein product [Sphacelaria rigidula]